MMEGMHADGSGTVSAQATLPRWLSSMLDHHVAHLGEHPRYQRVWWTARNSGSSVFITIRATAPAGSLTAEDERSFERLHVDGPLRHPELICKGRTWCTDGSDMSVTWQYCPTSEEGPHRAQRRDGWNRIVFS